MQIKHVLFITLAILTIFLSYNYLNPLEDKRYALVESDYTLKTYNISKQNISSEFTDKHNGTFFIHPGEVNASKGIFTFNINTKIQLDFSIRKGSPSGDIYFIIKKNGKEDSRFIVTSKQKNHVIINSKIKSGDKLEIIADNHGSTPYDWGNLEISKRGMLFNFNKYVIPFLWAMLFIYLVGKRLTYIAINAYIIFLLMLFAEKLNFGVLSFQSIISYTLLLFSITFIFTFIYQELTILKKFRLASLFSFISAFIIYVIPLSFIIYALNFDTKVTNEILFAVFQSNSGESYEFLFDYINIKYILLFILITTLVGFLLYRQEKKETLKIEKSLMMFLIITFSSVAIAQFEFFRLPNFVLKGFEKYTKEIKLFREVQEKRKTGQIKFKATKVKEGETYIVLIGESLNKNHMGLYGYPRETTPILSSMNQTNELLVFNNVYSNHTVTTYVLSLSLTEANQYNNKDYYHSLSIVDILKKANVKSYWLTNQATYGHFDNMVSVVAKTTDNFIPADIVRYDGQLINKVKNILAHETSENRVIFIHLLGNHYSYASRYPKEKYSIYKDALSLGKFGNIAYKNKTINEYDNSVVYNDYVTSSILKELQKEKGVTGFIYLSDHGEDVISNKAHNPNLFTFEMTQIPMIGWFSKEYQKKYKNKYANLLSRKDTLFSNDMLYDTMIGIFNIKTDKYNTKYDFTSNKYQLKANNALVLHGTKQYTDKDNYIYWQKVNTKFLIDNNQSSRVFPQAINSLGRLKDCWNDGFRSFELSLEFSTENNTAFYLQNNNIRTDITFDKYLSSINYKEIESIVIDLRNVDKTNYDKVLDKLTILDNKFHIKNKILIEMSEVYDFIKKFEKYGWHISYYIPSNSNIKDLQNLAKTLADKIKIYGLSNISFNHKLYPFIKQYLEPKITENILYHIYSNGKLDNINFKEQLLKDPLYIDDKVETLLRTYKSQF